MSSIGPVPSVWNITYFNAYLNCTPNGYYCRFDQRCTIYGLENWFIYRESIIEPLKEFRVPHEICMFCLRNPPKIQSLENKRKI